MKKLAMVCLFLFAGMAAAAAQQGLNFYGSWTWNEVSRNQKEKGNQSQLTVYPKTDAGKTVRIRYCYNKSCNDYVANRIPSKDGRYRFSFRWGKGYFEFTVNKARTEMEGVFWMYGDRNDPESAHVVMRLVG